MTTELTRRIRAYRDGDDDWDDLTAWLRAFARENPTTAAQFLSMSLQAAYEVALLTEDEQNRLLRAAW